MEHVEGVNRGDIILYALSTCVWCKKTRRLLEDMGVGYSYIYVDLLPQDERERVNKEVERWNPRCSFPTLVVNNERCVIGFSEDEIREALSG
ncbi:glutaredoxin family protein [Candidatus Latescibacterota bacterium]